MTTTRAANRNTAVDSASGCSRRTTTPTSPGPSAASSHVLADLQRDAVTCTWELTVRQLHQAFSQCMLAPSTGLPAVAASPELA